MGPRCSIDIALLWSVGIWAYRAFLWNRSVAMEDERTVRIWLIWYYPFSVFLVSHRFIISSKTEVRSSSRSERRDTRSTLRANFPSKNCWRPTRSNRSAPSSKSAKRPRSLSAWKSPRAYEPKIPLISALYLWRISSYAPTIVF